MRFWDVVLITASSERQAELFRDEIQRRRLSGVFPVETEFLVVPDPVERKVGSGGATINALGVLGKGLDWWRTHRALLIHSGGDSRRLPQYSPSGKLFGVLPSRTQPKEHDMGIRRNHGSIRGVGRSYCQWTVSGIR